MSLSAPAPPTSGRRRALLFGPRRRASTRERLPPAMRRLAVIATLAATADWYMSFAAFWIAAERGYSGLQIAGLVMAARAPTLAGGLVGGRLVDVRGPRRMILAETAARASLFALLTVLALLHQDGFWPLVAVAAGCSLCAPVTYAGTRTLAPRLVSVAQVGRANTLLALTDQVPIIASAALAGPALAWLGAGAFAVPAAMLVAACWLARGISSSRSRPIVVEPSSAPARRHRIPAPVIALITLSTVYFFVYGPFQPLLPVLVEQNLHGGATTYAVLRIAVGLGAVVGLATAPYLTSLDRPGLVNAWGAVLYGLSILPLVFVHSTLWALVVYFVSGIVWGPYSAIEATALQRWTRPEEHGRVFGLQRALIISAIPAGGAIGSLALDRVGVTAILGGSAVLCSVVGLLALCYAPLRKKG